MSHGRLSIVMVFSVCVESYCHFHMVVEIKMKHRQLSLTDNDVINYGEIVK